MSKMHFIALAKEIAQIESQECRRIAAQTVASVASQFNPRFDRARFFAACGVI